MAEVVVSISVDSTTVAAGESVRIWFKRTGDPETACAVVWQFFTDDNGPAFTEYADSVINFDPGDMERLLELTTDATRPEYEITMQLDSIMGGGIDPDANMVVVQVSGEAPPVELPEVGIAAVDDSVMEGETAQFLITRTHGDVVSSVQWTRSGTVADEDFIDPEHQGTVRFEIGELEKTLEFPLKDDSTVEHDETLTVALDEPVAAVIGDEDQATTTILGDDTVPALPKISVRAEQGTINEGNADITPVRFIVSRVGDLSEQSKVKWTRGGTIQDSDWQSVPNLTGTCTFAPGVTERITEFKLKGDIEIEDDETVTLTLSEPENAEITTSEAKITIVNDDVPDGGDGNGANGGDGNGGGGGDDGKPVAKRTLYADGVDEFKSIYGTSGGEFPSAIRINGPDRKAPLRPGDQVACKPGIYPGTHALKWSGSGDLEKGTVQDPILVCPDGDGSVKFTGQIATEGKWITLWGLDFSGSSKKVLVKAPGTRISRCLFDRTSAGTGQGAVMNEGNDIRWFTMDHCDARDITSAWVWMGVEPSDKYHGAHIYKCYVNGHTADSSNEAVFCFLTDAFGTQRVCYELIRFENCMKKTGSGGVIGQKEMISVKTGNCEIIGCTQVACNGGRFTFRQTRNGRFDDNWTNDNAASAYIFGDGHKCKNNKYPISLRGGDAYTGDKPPPGCEAKARKTTVRYSSGSQCKGAQCAARYCTVEDSGSKVLIGECYDGDNFKARDIKLTRCPKPEINPTMVVAGSIQEIDSGQQNCTAKELKPSEVGRNAA